jgi:membrane-bound metal-dependent hydrolase YbcI (DUF457 family)
LTPVGHTLTGFAIATLVVPRHWSTRAKLGTYAAMAFLANAPDAPLPGWGHDRYDISHSLFVTAGVVTLLVLIARVAFPKLPKSLLVGGAVAWFSHLLLDTFYNHGKGLAIFWPVSDERVALPVKWFAVMMPSPILGAHNLRVFAVEGAVYGVMFAAAVLIRRLLQQGNRVNPE